MPEFVPPLLVVAAALVDADGRVLLQERPAGKTMAGLWEFPGGKIEPGETPEAALVRELREELGIDTETACLAPATFASASLDLGQGGGQGGGRHLLLLLYVCRKWRGVPQPLEGGSLCWKYPAEMFALPMPLADLPLVSLLEALL